MPFAQRWSNLIGHLVIVRHRVRRRIRSRYKVWGKTSAWTFVSLTTAALLCTIIWKGPTWFDSSLIDAIKDPEKKAQAINSSRTTILQMVLALGGLATIIFTARTYLLSRSGQVADRYTKAATQLVSANRAERIGAIHSLARLMRDSPRDHTAVVELLAGFVRDSRPKSSEFEEDVDEEFDFDVRYETGRTWQHERLPIDVQAALNALNKRPSHPEGPWIQLGGTDLRGARLLRGWVDNLHFEGANLRGADFVGAKAEHLGLHNCDLRGANLSAAEFPTAHMQDSDLRYAYIRWANLRHAGLDNSNLRGATLEGSDLTGASLENCDLRGVDLTSVKGLAADQLAGAYIDDETELPPYLENV